MDHYHHLIPASHHRNTGFISNIDILTYIYSITKLPPFLTMVIPGIDRTTGLGGLPKVTLRHPAGPSAEIYLFGATLTSYKSAKGNEVLFVSKDALFNGQKGMYWNLLEPFLSIKIYRLCQPCLIGNPLLCM